MLSIFAGGRSDYGGCTLRQVRHGPSRSRDVTDRRRVPRDKLYRLYPPRAGKAGYQHIPVISINLSKLESNPGFKLTPMLLLRAVYAINFGDIFMRCVYRMRPYEAVPGSVEEVHQKWIRKCCDFLGRKYMSFHTYKKCAAR